MPKQCKPTKEAIYTRIAAFERQLQMKEAYLPFDDPVPIEIFGIKHKIKRKGIFTIENIIEELK